ncbi:hypothetical protein TNCV_1090801 [Trichonephila clavipes]|uniref:Uncharacterized protein n=1 Tax=Trichonephila clavipes TaxID=2585209 RepID=A0A8X6SPN4_TRICX|nr:hypothetical protein TNCV_1090801 [Trichonephila clavipes]
MLSYELNKEEDKVDKNFIKKSGKKEWCFTKICVPFVDDPAKTMENEHLEELIDAVADDSIVDCYES